MEAVPNTQKESQRRGPVTATEVTDATQRLECLPQLVGFDCVLLEHAVYDMLRMLSEDYSGGLWAYYRLSNGGFYMAPEKQQVYRIRCDGNGFVGDVDADVAGILACAMAYSHLSFRTRGERFARAFELLSDFIHHHPESRRIRAALD